MELTSQPTLPWRAGYVGTLGLVGSLTKAFMYGLNVFEVHGLDRFLALLESRKDVERRQRGLITGRSCSGCIREASKADGYR